MRRYFGFGVVSTALLFSAISTSSSAIAFPVIMKDLNTSLVVAGWILTVYSLAATIVMPLAGKLSDLLGRKNAFLLYTGLFTAGSILSAIAPNIYMLIFARVIQAMGGGGFMPSAAGIVSDEFPENRQRYIGFFTSIWPVGTIIGPSLGGWMVPTFGWRSVFWVNVPLGVAVTILGFILLKSSKKKETKTNMDLVGSGLLLGSLTAIMFAFTEFGANGHGIPWLIIAGLFVLGAGMFYAFWRRERSIKDPIIDFTLLKGRPFMASNIYNLVYGGCILGVFSLMPLYTISVYHLSVLQSGIVLTPRAIGQIISSLIISAFLIKWGYRRPILVGTLVVVAAMVILGFQPHGFFFGKIQITDIAVLLIILGVWGAAIGTIAPAANNACIELMPDKVSTISGLRGMFRNIGSSFTVAVMTVVIHNVSDPARAYTIIFFASAVICILAVPTIFMMPASARETGPVLIPATDGAK
jgi:EmrB/QacA subfamily drug resistance transporter